MTIEPGDWVRFKWWFDDADQWVLCFGEVCRVGERVTLHNCIEINVGAILEVRKPAKEELRAAFGSGVVTTPTQGPHPKEGTP